MNMEKIPKQYLCVKCGVVKAFQSNLCQTCEEKIIRSLDEVDLNALENDLMKLNDDLDLILKDIDSFCKRLDLAEKELKELKK